MRNGNATDVSEGVKRKAPWPNSEICEGNEENEKNVLKEYNLEVTKSSKHSIKVSMIIESDSKINVMVEVNEKEVKNDTIKVKFF